MKITKEQALIQLLRKGVYKELGNYQFSLRNKTDDIKKNSELIEQIDKIMLTIEKMSKEDLLSIFNSKFKYVLDSVTEQDIEDTIFNSTQKFLPSYRNAKTIEKFLSNAFNYLKANGEYLDDGNSKPIRFKTDDDVLTLMSNKQSFMDSYDIIKDESDYQGLEIEDILKSLPFKIKRSKHSEY